ncbi:MAG: hypothetical protein AAGF12_36615 [Myxococcota bacterium]
MRWLSLGAVLLYTGCSGDTVDPVVDAAVMGDTAVVGDTAVMGDTAVVGADAAPDGPLDPGPFCDPQPIFDQKCAVAGCHDSSTSIAGLDLSRVGDGASFVGDPANPDGMCDGDADRIDRDSFANSLILRKLTDPTVCGNRMPLRGQTIEADEVTCIAGWLGNAPR